MLAFLKQSISKLGNYDVQIIVFISFIISVLSILYFYQTQQILLYKDARAHLDIARRITDSLTPGFIQVGSVWLPLYQLLLFPLVSNDFLWRSGLAGGIISGISYVGACFFMYKILKKLTKSIVISFIGLTIFCLNPNLLYLQSVPLDATLTIFMICGSLYFFFGLG